VGYARRNYFVPLPEGGCLEAINATLRQRCVEDQQRIMARGTDPIASRLETERRSPSATPRPSTGLGTSRGGAGPLHRAGALPDQ
jgi:hypothetical protein